MWGSLLTLSRGTVESGDFNPFQHKMEEAITCSRLQVTSKGTNHRVLVCLSCVIQLVLHQFGAMLFAAFISGSSARAPQGSEEPPLRRTHPLQYPLPAGDSGKQSHQACPAIVHTQICPSAALSIRLLSWVPLGRTGPEASLPSPTAAHPTPGSAPALHRRPS